MNSPRPPVAASHIVLLAIGMLGVCSSGPAMAAASAVPALAMSWWRTGLGSIAIAPRALTVYRAELRGLTAGQWRDCIFAGLMLAGHFATWVGSLHYTSVASATALVCLQVAWVVVIARFSGATVARPVVIGMVLSLVGVVVISGVDLTLSTRAAVGDLMAIAGGIFAAFYIVAGSRIRSHASTTTYTFVCYSSCALVLLGCCVAFGVPLAGYSAKNWALIIFVTIAAQLLGHSVINHLLAVMSPTFVSMVLLLEVPGAALLAAVFLGQAPPAAVYLGLALICVGLALVVRERSTTDAPVEAPVD